MGGLPWNHAWEIYDFHLLCLTYSDLQNHWLSIRNLHFDRTKIHQTTHLICIQSITKKVWPYKKVDIYDLLANLFDWIKGLEIVMSAQKELCPKMPETWIFYSLIMPPSIMMLITSPIYQLNSLILSLIFLSHHGQNEFLTCWYNINVKYKCAKNTLSCL